MKKIKENKENLIEKSPLLMKIEKTEVPKGLVKIGFDEPELIIKKEKKTRLKPFVKEISKEEIPELPDLLELPPLSEVSELPKINKPSKISKLPKPLKLPDLPPIPILTKKEEIVNKEKNTYQEQKILNSEETGIKDLEKEIKSKKKLLKFKKEEEKKRLEEEELKRIEEEKNKFIETQEIPKETQEVKLISENEVLLRICPECNRKIERSKVKQIGLTLIQHFVCKNKNCGFQKEIRVGI